VLVREAEQQPERVAVGRDRSRAGLQLPGETVGEERRRVGATGVMAAPPGRR
jgi:hypothetical protein